MALLYIDPDLIRREAWRGANTYPHAEYKPIPEATTQPHIMPRSVIFHTMAGPRSTSPENLWEYMNRGDINGECHVQLGYSSIIQALPFNVRADNNYKANSWVEDGVRFGSISVETQDDGANSNIEDDPWTDYQLEHLAGIAAFAHLRYGVPLDRVTDTWTDGGIDGHRAWPEWSVYTGKTCPGGKRWTQIPDVLALARQVAYPPIVQPDLPPEEPDMAKLALARFRRYGNQYLLIPVASAEQARRMGMEGQAPVVIDLTPAQVAELEAAQGHKLSPTVSGD